MFPSDGGHELALRGQRPHDPAPPVTRVRFFAGVHQTVCHQYSDIPSHGRPVSPEHGSQLRNRRRILSYRIENANPLRSEYPKQIRGIFKGQAHFGKQPFAAIQLLRTRRRSPEKSVGGARAQPFDTLNRLIHLPASPLPVSTARTLPPETVSPGTGSR